MNRHTYLKLSSLALIAVGLVLLFGPRSWFPYFYNSLYFGFVALVCPLLIYLPFAILKGDTPQKKNLILEISMVIAFSITINMAGELGLYQLYKVGFEYDKFAHFLVSMLFAFVLCEALSEWRRLSPKRIILTVIPIVLSAGFLWEGFEAASDFLFNTKTWGVYGQNIAWDTYKDIGFNALGILSGILIFLIPNKSKGTASPVKIAYSIPLSPEKWYPEAIIHNINHMAKMGEKVEHPFRYLMEDHKKVAELFKKLEDTTENAEKTREELFGEINSSLSLHAELEEKTVYPVLEEMKKTHELTMESEQEHHVMKMILKELEALDQTTEEWTAKAQVLIENVEHHVEEEEKPDGLFKKAESVMKEEEIEALRKNMESFLQA